MNIFEEFPTKYLKAADIQQETVVTMQRVERDKVGDDENKPVLYFNEFEKGLVLNKTNANNIAQVHGPETNNWSGKQMVLATAWVDFQGKSTQALRVYPPSHQQLHQQTQPHPQAAQQQPVYDDRNPPPPSGYPAS